MAANLAIGTAGAYLGDSAAAELFAGGKHPVIAGQGTRPGTATRVEGGYKLTGSWSFGSGLLHSTHTHSLGIIAETGEARIFVTPIAQANLLLDSWNVMGLRGTGSVDYTFDGVFVPDAYTHGAFVTEPMRGGAIFRSGIMGFAEICHSGWAVGVGRRPSPTASTCCRARRAFAAESSSASSATCMPARSTSRRSRACGKPPGASSPASPAASTGCCSISSTTEVLALALATVEADGAVNARASCRRSIKARTDSQR